MSEQRIQQESSTGAPTGAPPTPADGDTRTLARDPSDPLEWAARMAGDAGLPLARPGSKQPRVPRDYDPSLIIKPEENLGSGEPRTRSGRIVKAPQAFVNEADDSFRRSRVGNLVGEGVALGSLPTFQLQGVEEEVLRRLHSALYGTPGQQQSRKKDLRDWQGNSADDAASRLRKPIASWKIEELRAVSRLCGLAPSKTKSEHERGLVAFLQKPYCVPPGKEPAEPTKKTGTKRTVEQPAPTSSRSGAACGSSAISVVRKKTRQVEGSDTGRR